MLRRFLALALLLSMNASAPDASAQESSISEDVLSTPESREAVSMTVYNGGFAVVREVRPVTLASGRSVVRFEGVPARIDPTSLSITSLTAPGSVSVREQNYQNNLIGTQSVLDAAVGQRVRLTRTLGDRAVTETGVLISQPNQGRIVRLDDGRVLVNPEGTIELESLPPTLRSRPSLLWRLNAARGGEHRLQASYMTEGVGWKADYVAVVNEAETAIDLTGWVTLTNTSGAAYRNADLQLLAGDVRRVQERPQQQRMYEMAMAADAAGRPAFEEESFFEYHLYTLDGQTTLAENETKQMELLSASEAGVSRRLVFDGSGTYFPFYRRQRPGSVGTEMNAAVVLELANTEANSMGMPLPAGKVRVYKADRRGNLQFLGEDLIDHTPRGEQVDLYIGDAFDVVGTRTQVADRRISNTVREITVEVEVRNRKETAAEIDVVERLYGQLEITNASHEAERLDATTIQFPVTVPAGQTETVRYTARITQ